MFGIFGRGKKIQENAGALLAEIPRGAFGVLLMTHRAYKRGSCEQANRVHAELPEQTELLLRHLDRPRDPLISAGPNGDKVGFDRWMRLLAPQGYDETASTIVAFVFQHSLEEHLDRVSAEFDLRAKSAKPR